jgi:transposase/DNA-binding HxlR family transcriptional regulator
MFEVQIIETSVYRRIPAPDDALEQKELRESILAAINSLSEKNRLAISLHYLDGMSYKEIADFLKVSISTIEGRLYRARKQLKEEMIKMTKEVIDTSRIEAELQEMRNQITDLRRQFEIFRQEESGVFNAERKAAFDIICRLPSDAENPITWGFAGAYRYGNRGKKGRVSFWSSSIDEYINAVTDSEVSDFASMFTNRIAINVLKQLIEGQKSVAELAKVCGITDGKMNQTLEPLIAANLVHRKEGDVIKAEYDALAYILTLVNITRLYAEHLKSEK